ncbi:MAG: CopG family antitoxin [Sedimenticola sp.]
MSNKKAQLNPPYLDEDEQEIIEALERGEFQPVDDQSAAKQAHQAAAKATLKKRAINLRLPERDIQRIKRLASRDGIPYQTLIASILHRYAEGTLKRVD